MDPEKCIKIMKSSEKALWSCSKDKQEFIRISSHGLRHSLNIFMFCEINTHLGVLYIYYIFIYTNYSIWGVDMKG